MEFLQLSYFCDAAQSENFSHTAKKFSVPPSNVSQTVKRLEAELGVELFDRSSNKIRLSDKGRVFYEGISQALAIIDQTKKLIAEEDNPSGDIRILNLTNRRIVTLAIERFKRSYPDVQILINHDTGADYSDYDVIISDSLKGACNHVFEPLLTESISLAVSLSSPLSRNDSVNVSELRHERFVSMSKDSRLAEYTESICHAKGFDPNVVISTDDPYYVRKYVELGLGVALVPTVSWRGLFSERVKLIDIGNYTRTTGIYISAHKALSTRVTLFADALREVFRAEGSADGEI
jgi:DNA-binding transcriptional LysR family regulator